MALFADMVKRHGLDMNDYLARRIVAVELGKFINEAREPRNNTFVDN